MWERLEGSTVMSPSETEADKHADLRVSVLASRLEHAGVYQCRLWFIVSRVWYVEDLRLSLPSLDVMFEFK